MRRYFKKILPLVCFTILLMILSACGDGGFETESRLEIQNISPSVVQSDVVEETDDYGRDGEPNTGDEGEDDGRPQPGEAVTNPLIEDVVTVSFTNTKRAGSEAGVDIELYRYVISYYDENGMEYPFAPQSIHDMQLVVPADGAATFDLFVVTFAMKNGWLENDQWVVGLREIWLYSLGDFTPLLYAQLDFYGRDPLNNEPAFTSGIVEIHFINYLPTGG